MFNVWPQCRLTGKLGTTVSFKPSRHSAILQTIGHFCKTQNYIKLQPHCRAQFWNSAQKQRFRIIQSGNLGRDSMILWLSQTKSLISVVSTLLFLWPAQLEILKDESNQIASATSPVNDFPPPYISIWMVKHITSDRFNSWCFSPALAQVMLVLCMGNKRVLRPRSHPQG